MIYLFSALGGGGTSAPPQFCYVMQPQPSPSQTHDQIQALHTAYCTLTGWSINARLYEHEWLAFMQFGYTQDDLSLVLRTLKRDIANGKRFEGAMRFRNIISDLAKFDQELAEARARQRNLRPVPTAKARAVEQLRPTADPEGHALTTPARSLRDVMLAATQSRAPGGPYTT